MARKSKQIKSKRKLSRSKRTQAEQEQEQNSQPTHISPLKPLNKTQSSYINSIKTNTITFGIGPAGTGKSFVAASLAADMLKSKKIERIILVRPAVESGESFGFLPGELEEKYSPFMEPLMDALERRLGKSFVAYLLKRKAIECKPLSYMRGKDFRDCMIILDEAQNTSPVQMKMFLTRIGENCTVVVDGDLEQKDIRGTSGLADAMDRLKTLNDCGVVEFTIDDVVRSGIVRDILLLYAA